LGRNVPTDADPNHPGNQESPGFPHGEDVNRERRLLGLKRDLKTNPKVNIIYAKKEQPSIEANEKLPEGITESFKEVVLMRQGKIPKKTWWEVRDEI